MPLPGLSTMAGGGLGGFSTTKINPVSGGRNDNEMGDVRTGGLRQGGLDLEDALPVIAVVAVAALVALYIWKKV